MDSLRERIADFIGFAPVPELPPRQIVERQEHKGYTRTLMRYVVPDGDQVEAFLFEPVGGGSPGGVLVLHQHNSEWGIGKGEVAGLVGDPMQAFGPALARCGLTVLAPDTTGFESRLQTPGVDTSLAPSLSKPGSTPEGWLQYYNQMAHRLVYGDLLMRKILVDSSSAVSVLRAVTPSPTPVGVIGHSMGGGQALFLGALDTRLAFTCASGAVSSYRFKRSHGMGLEMSLVIPGFAAQFDLADLLRCIAPRVAFVVSADQDAASGDAPDIVQEARGAFEAVGAGEHLADLRVQGGHALDSQRFDAIVAWVARQVGRAG